jgi:hypothetical protein
MAQQGRKGSVPPPQPADIAVEPTWLRIRCDALAAVAQLLPPRRSALTLWTAALDSFARG